MQNLFKIVKSWPQFVLIMKYTQNAYNWLQRTHLLKRDVASWLWIRQKIRVKYSQRYNIPLWKIQEISDTVQ